MATNKNFKVKNGINANDDITTTGHYIADTHFKSSDSNATLSATGGGGVYLRPDGNSNSANQVYIQSGTGNATFSGTITSGNIIIEDATPKIFLTDTGNNPDYQIINNNGVFTIYDGTNATSRLTINSGGDLTIGSSSYLNGNVYIGTSSGANLIFKRASANYIWADQTSGYFALGTNGRTTSVANANLVLNTDQTSDFKSDVDVAGNLVVTGDLTVNGTTTTLNTQTLDVEDKNITLNYSTGDSSASANGAGLTIQDAVSVGNDATLTWNTANDSFNFSHNLNFGDNVYAQFGASNDLRIHHNGTTSSITNLTGNFYITNTADDKDIIFETDDGSGGVTQYLTLDGSATNIKLHKNLTAYDNVQVQLGTGADLRIYHLNDSFIHNNTGDLYIENDATDKDVIFRGSDGAGGLDTYFYIDTSNESTRFTTYPLKFSDNIRALFGVSGDMQIYHDGTNSKIENSTGDFIISQKADDGDMSFYCDDGSGGTTPYFYLDGGNTNINFEKNLYIKDNVRADFGNASDLRIEHNATDSFITNHTGDLKLIQYADDGDISFQSDDGSGGITEYFRLDGGITKTLFSKDTKHLDSIRALFGTNDDLRIQHTGSAGYVANYTGNLSIQNNTDDGDVVIQSDNGSGSLANYFMADGSSGSANLYHYGSLKLNTSSSGVLTTGRLDVTQDLRIRGDSSSGYVGVARLFVGDSGGSISFDAGNNGTDMVLDSSGNLLVGKTSSSGNTAGAELRSNGGIFGTKDGAYVARFNRLTDDGSIVEFQKDGSTVGSIGAYNSATAILSGSAASYSGLYLNTNRIEPVGNNFGSEIRADNTIDIGSSTYKFKDLHLSGTISSGAITSTATESTLRNSSGVTLKLTTNGSAGSVSSKLPLHIDFNGYGQTTMARIRSWDESSSTADGFLEFYTNNYTGSHDLRRVLLLDNDRNATFSGTITSGAITSTGHIQASGALKVTETGTTQVIMIGNQDSGGANKPAMIMGVNGYLRFGHGSSWSSEGGTFTETLNLASGNATFSGTIQNDSVWINDGTNYNNYNENIRLFNPANNVSVIAFSATGTGGTPTSSILGYSDRFETRLGSTWRTRVYSSGLYVNGGYYVGTTAVIDSSRNLTNIGTISSGAITVNNQATGDQRHLFIDGYNAEYDFRSNSTSNYRTTFNMNNNGLQIGHDSSSRSFALRTAGTDRLTISGAGTFTFNNNNLQSIGTISSGAITSTSSITANSGGNVIQIGTDGNIEITRTSGGAYIDFKDSSSEDYDQRIQATSTGHSFSGTISSGAITSSGVFTTTAGSPSRFNGGIAVGSDNDVYFYESATGQASIRTGSTGAYKFFAFQTDGYLKSPNGYIVGSTTVIDSSRNLINIGSIDTNGSINIREGSELRLTAGTNEDIGDIVYRRNDQSEKHRIWDGGANGLNYRYDGGSAYQFGITTNTTLVKIGGTEVIDSSRNLTNIANITSTGVLDISAGASNIPLSISGSSSIYTSAAIKNTSTGDAILWFDASNGDLSGSDYASIRQTNTGLNLLLKTESSGGDIIMQSAGTTALTLDSSQNATFTGNVNVNNGLLRVGTANTTSGSMDIYGGSTGSEGGEIRIHTTNDYDGTYEWYRIDTYNDDLRIGRQGNTDLYIFQDGLVKVENNFEVVGDINLDYTSAIHMDFGANGDADIIDATESQVRFGGLSSGSDITAKILGFNGNSTLTMDDGEAELLGSYGELLNFKVGTSTRGSIGSRSEISNNIFMETDSGTSAIGFKISTYAGSSYLAPSQDQGAIADNQVRLGFSSNRYVELYAVDGSINTSDRNEKQDIQELSDAEQRVAVACKGLIRRYKWNHAVEEKGDDARYHFGIIAQDLQDAFEAEGLDAGDYGMFTSDTWTDEEGNEQTRLGVRYNELLAFIIATL